MHWKSLDSERKEQYHQMPRQLSSEFQVTPDSHPDKLHEAKRVVAKIQDNVHIRMYGIQIFMFTDSLNAV